MDSFIAIEKILHFHHTTSRQPLRVNLVRLRAFRNGTPVSLKDIECINRIYPDAYRIWNQRGNLVMDALDLPHNADIRRETFFSRWQDKENLSGKVTKEDSDSTNKEPFKQLENNNNNTETEEVSTPPLQQKPHSSRILMGRLTPVSKNKNLTLLERIRAKEASLKRSGSMYSVETTREKFLRGQLPKLKRVLDDIAAQRNGLSLEMSQIMDLLRTNLFKLGDSEIKRVLHLLEESYPNFCSIVKVGETTHVKLRPPVAA